MKDLRFCIMQNMFEQSRFYRYAKQSCRPAIDYMIDNLANDAPIVPSPFERLSTIACCPEALPKDDDQDLHAILQPSQYDSTTPYCTTMDCVAALHVAAIEDALVALSLTCKDMRAGYEEMLNHNLLQLLDGQLGIVSCRKRFILNGARDAAELDCGYGLRYMPPYAISPTRRSPFSDFGLLSNSSNPLPNPDAMGLTTSVWYMSASVYETPGAPSEFEFSDCTVTQKCGLGFVAHGLTSLCRRKEAVTISSYPTIHGLIEKRCVLFPSTFCDVYNERLLDFRYADIALFKPFEEQHDAEDYWELLGTRPEQDYQMVTLDQCVPSDSSRHLHKWPSIPSVLCCATKSTLPTFGQMRSLRRAILQHPCKPVPNYDFPVHTATSLTNVFYGRRARDNEYLIVRPASNKATWEWLANDFTRNSPLSYRNTDISTKWGGDKQERRLGFTVLKK